MRSVYAAWLAGFLLKLAGASWDIAYHFRYLRETLSGAHMVNTAGNLVLGLTFLWEWYHRTPERHGPLVVFAAGFATFLAAIPFDVVWHALFGLDLTTWSPSHLALFGGTAVMVAGILLLFCADLGWRPGHGLDAGRMRASEKIVLAILGVLLMDAVMFPAGFNEYSTVGFATKQALFGPACPITVPANYDYTRMDPAIAARACLPDAIFYGTPHWLYPVYTIAGTVLVATLLRRLLPRPGWVLWVVGGLSLERWVASLLLVDAGWPASVIPWQYLAMALAIEAAWLLPVDARLRAALAAAGATAAAYAFFLWGPRLISPTIPLDASAWPLALGASLLASAIAWLAWGSLTPRLEARGDPRHLHWRPTWSDAKAFVAARRR